MSNSILFTSPKVNVFSEEERKQKAQYDVLEGALTWFTDQHEIPDTLLQVHLRILAKIQAINQRSLDQQPTQLASDTLWLSELDEDQNEIGPEIAGLAVLNDGPTLDVDNTALLAVTAIKPEISPASIVTHTKISKNDVQLAFGKRKLPLESIADKISKFSGSCLVAALDGGFVHRATSARTSAQFLITTGTAARVLAIAKAIGAQSLTLDTAVALSAIYNTIGMEV
jgi:hypothetical protein